MEGISLIEIRIMYIVGGFVVKYMLLLDLWSLIQIFENQGGLVKVNLFILVLSIFFFQGFLLILGFVRLRFVFNRQFYCLQIRKNVLWLEEIKFLKNLIGCYIYLED